MNPTSRPQTRFFSRTRQNAKSLATFTPTSSPELNAILHKFRQEVFLPSVVSEEYNKLMTRKSKHEILSRSPGVSVSVRKAVPPSVHLSPNEEEEIIRLQPVKEDFPFYESMRTIYFGLEQDSSAAAWENLIPFLEGMRIARRTVPWIFGERLARKANMQGAGRWNQLITAASMAERTQLRLSNIRLTRELLRGAFERALNNESKSAEPSKTVAAVVRLLEAPEHYLIDEFWNSPGAYRHADMRQDPFVLATKLTMSSIDVLDKNNGVDQEGVVSRDIQKLLTLNARTQHERFTEEELQEGYLIGVTTQIWEPMQENFKLMDMSVLYTALALANKVNTQPYLSKPDSINTSAALQKLLRNVTAKCEALAAEVANIRAKQNKKQGGNRGQLFHQLAQDAVKRY